MKEITRAALGAALLIMATTMASCRLHQVDGEPPPPVPLPPAFSPTPSTVNCPDRWWRSFDSASLSGLVDRALAGNLDLQAAWARLDQAAALARRSGAASLPAFTLEADAGRSKRVVSTMGTKVTTRDKSFSLSLGATYEVDLWGRLAALEDAQLAEFKATRRDLEALAMTLAARVADTWFAIQGERELARLLQAQIDTGTTYLELVELRFANGQASAVDVYQQRQQLAATQAQLPLSDSRLQVLHHQLALLLGREPVSYTAPKEGGLPDLPALPDPGIPARLLARRPDIAAARLRVTAADHSLGAAMADRLPALRLSGSTGWQATQIEDLFDDWVWNLAAGLTAPLFDGGRRAADEDAARASLRAKTLQLGQAFLTAVTEVEDALIQEKRQAEYLQALTEQLTITRRTLRETRLRYGNGLNDYLPVLTALQAVQARERELVTARRQLLAYRVQLHRALGGGWTTDLNRSGRTTNEDVKQ